MGPSLASSNTVSRGGERASSFLVLRNRFDGYNVVLVYGSKVVKRDNGLT